MYCRISCVQNENKKMSIWNRFVLEEMKGNFELREKVFELGHLVDSTENDR